MFWEHINLVAVLAAGIANMVIGALWYSPILFGRKWMAVIGKSDTELEEMKKEGMTKAYVLSFISALVMAYALALFVGFVDAVTIWDGVKVGLYAWLGFIATTSLATVLFEQRPFGLYFINNGFNLVALLVMGTILVMWS